MRLSLRSETCELERRALGDIVLSNSESGMPIEKLASGTTSMPQNDTRGVEGMEVEVPIQSKSASVCPKAGEAAKG